MSGYRIPEYRCLVSLAGKMPVNHAGDSGSIHGQTNTQGLKLIEQKVLPLFLYLQTVKPSHLPTI